jgi:hypothetical protein
VAHQWILADRIGEESLLPYLWGQRQACVSTGDAEDVSGGGPIGALHGRIAGPKGATQVVIWEQREGWRRGQPAGVCIGLLTAGRRTYNQGCETSVEGWGPNGQEA